MRLPFGTVLNSSEQSIHKIRSEDIMSIKTIKLQPKDGEFRTIDIEMAKMSVTLRDMIENAVVVETAVPLPMSVQVLDKIIEWLSHHFDDPIESESDSDEDESCAKCAEDISAWDKSFYAMEQQLFFDVILAANYLHIEGLLRIGCKVAAEQIRGKTPEYVRQLWNIECDLEPEEEERLKRENAWTEK